MTLPCCQRTSVHCRRAIRPGWDRWRALPRCKRSKRRDRKPRRATKEKATRVITPPRHERSSFARPGPPVYRRAIHPAAGKFSFAVVSWPDTPRTREKLLRVSTEALYCAWVCVFVTDSPSSFEPHPNLSDGVNRDIVQSEIEGGVFLHNLLPATVLEIETLHHCYTAVLLAENKVLISGHPTYCPQPVPVTISGSTWGGSMLKRCFVGRGMHLEFHHPEYPHPIVTSRIREVRECPQVAYSPSREYAPMPPNNPNY